MKNICKYKIQNSGGIRYFRKKDSIYIGESLTKLLKKKESFSCNKNTYYRILQHKIFGEYLSYVVRLRFVGVGFRVEAVSDGIVTLKLGYSHLLNIKLPRSIEVVSPKRTALVLRSSDLQYLKKYVNLLCSLKKRDSYKGKGIYKKNEKFFLKVGKKK